MAIEEQAPQIDIFGGPVPGQSMAASPESKMPWDGPPEFTSVKEASQAIFLGLLEPATLKSIVTLLQKDVPVSDITSVLLISDFSKGKYNPDLLMLLIEPVMYMIMAIADRFGIDPKIYKGEEEDYDSDLDEGVSASANKKDIDISIQKLFNNKNISPNLRNTMESSEVAQKLANVDVESLMQRPEPATEQESLLQQGR